MKCENCGKNEVTFVYRSNLNGKVTQRCLCSECAEKLGYTQKILARNQQLMENFFGGNFLEDFFSPMPRLLGSMDRFFGEDLFDDFFAEMPALGAASDREQSAPAEEKKEELVDEEEQSRFAKMRQLNALRMELKKAVHQENFEHAAKLRDQIHALENEKKESK